MVAGAFRVSDALVDLSPPESTVLHDLVVAHGRTRTKNELAVALRSRSRGDAPDADEVRAVERTVESLRGRLATAAATTLIVSDQGIGYRLDRG